MASALKPARNFICKDPCRPTRGIRARIISASLQLAAMAIASPAATVAEFCTTRARLSPTRPLTAAASADSLVAIAPLQKTTAADAAIWSTGEKKEEEEEEERDASHGEPGVGGIVEPGHLQLKDFAEG